MILDNRKSAQRAFYRCCEKGDGPLVQAGIKNIKIIGGHKNECNRDNKKH